MTCSICGDPQQLNGGPHVGSRPCRITAEVKALLARGLIPINPPAKTSEGHSNRAGSIRICEVLKLPFTLERSAQNPNHPWVCVNAEVEGLVASVVRANQLLAGYQSCPQTAKLFVRRRALLIEFDTLRRLGAEGDELYALLARAGLAGEHAKRLFALQSTSKRLLQLGRTLVASLKVKP